MPFPVLIIKATINGHLLVSIVLCVHACVCVCVCVQGGAGIIRLLISFPF